jgi:hypothetical protein
MVGWGLYFPQFFKEVPCKIIIGQLIQKGIKIHKIVLSLKLHWQAQQSNSSKLIHSRVVLGTCPTGHAPQTHNLASTSIRSQAMGTKARKAPHSCAMGLRPASQAYSRGKFHQKQAITKWLLAEAELNGRYVMHMHQGQTKILATLVRLIRHVHQVRHTKGHQGGLNLS